ncbi:hypothetical protein [Nisaea sp.]|uniref:hypothetical protein n=1 Tax=Nisaea sp. TaxID=2024842 RepID=UPI0032F005CC
MSSEKANPLVVFLITIQQYKRPVRLAKILEENGAKIALVFTFSVTDDENFKSNMMVSAKKTVESDVFDAGDPNFSFHFKKMIKENENIVFHLFAGQNFHVNESIKPIIHKIKDYTAKSINSKLVLDFYDVYFAHKIASDIDDNKETREYDHYKIDLLTEDNARTQVELYEMCDGLVARDLQWWVFRRCQGLKKIPSCFVPDLPGKINTKALKTPHQEKIKIIQGGNVPNPVKNAVQSMYFIVKLLLQVNIKISFLLPLHYRRRNWSKSKILDQWSDILSLSKERGDITLEASILDSEVLERRFSTADFGIHGVDGYVQAGIPKIARDKPVVALFCAGRLADYAEAGLIILGLEGLRLSRRILQEHTTWVNLESALKIAENGEDLHDYLAGERSRHEEAAFANAVTQRRVMAQRLIGFYESLFSKNA